MFVEGLMREESEESEKLSRVIFYFYLLSACRLNFLRLPSLPAKTRMNAERFSVVALSLLLVWLVALLAVACA